MTMLPRTIPTAQTIRSRQERKFCNRAAHAWRAPARLSPWRDGAKLPGEWLNGNSTEVNPIVLQAEVVGRASVSGAPT
jgi:hypothetical protein